MRDDIGNPDLSFGIRLNEGRRFFCEENGALRSRILTPRTPKLLWVNSRYFVDILGSFEAGVDYVRKRILPLLNDNSIAWADRYGGEGLKNNGGSGRAGLVDAFHMKGVGKTPLASPFSDYQHSHGLVSLEECMREAVYAELVGDRFPYGAVPVIAIVDVGSTIGWRAEKKMAYERAAILVRPPVLRPAHFERAVYYRSGSPVEGAKDTARVRSNYESMASIRGQDFMKDVFFREFWCRWGSQIAFGLIHRVSTAAQVTSNIALDGRYLDFGAASTLPNWGRALLAEGFPVVGNEHHSVINSTKSMAYYFSRFSGMEGEQGQIFEHTATDSFWGGYKSTFVRELLIVSGVEDAIAKNISTSDIRDDFYEKGRLLFDELQPDAYVFYHKPADEKVFNFSDLWLSPESKSLQSWRDLILHHELISDTDSAHAIVRLKSAQMNNLYKFNIKACFEDLAKSLPKRESKAFDRVSSAIESSFTWRGK